MMEGIGFMCKGGGERRLASQMKEKRGQIGMFLLFVHQVESNIKEDKI